MADTFMLDLVTPEKTLFSGQVQELVAPGLMGEFGVLAGHANMLVELAAGRLLFKDGSDEKVYVAAGGFAEVGQEKVTVLLDDAVSLDSIDPASLEQEIKELEETAPAEDEEGFDARQQVIKWKTLCRDLAVK